MKLSGFLNKPRWQAKEASVRRAGVAEDDEPELLANLSSIARQDPDPGVRSAALASPKTTTPSCSRISRRSRARTPIPAYEALR